MHVVTLSDMQAEIRRELTQRRKVCARWVEAGTMTQGDAERHVARLKACGELLDEVAACSGTKPELKALGRNREIEA